MRNGLTENLKRTKFKPFVPPDEKAPQDILIWMAGFFDGEGCITIARQKSSTKRRNDKLGYTSGSTNYYGYSLTLAVSQKTPEPLERFQKYFGGHFFKYKLGNATYYRWQLWSNGAMFCIKQLLPYLLVKRPIALLGIRFQEQMTEWNQNYGRLGYPDEVLAGREMFYFQCRELNAGTKTNNREKPEYVGPQSPKYKDAFDQPTGGDPNLTH